MKKVTIQFPYLLVRTAKKIKHHYIYTYCTPHVYTAYVPPAKRNVAIDVIDENSENSILLRRKMNGILNKLSLQVSCCFFIYKYILK